MSETERIRAMYASSHFAAALEEDWTAHYHLRNPSGIGLYYRHALERAVIGVLNDAGVRLAGRTVADLGCASGHHLRLFVELGVAPADCTGLELMPDRVAAAEAKNPAMTFVEGDATDTGLDGPFNVVCQFGTLCNLLEDESRHAMAREMRRLVAPGGVILWHDIALQQPGAQTRAVPPREVAELLGLEPVGQRWLFHRFTEPLVERGLGWAADAIDRHAPRRLVPRFNYVAVFRA